jgi:hypothetical protein
MYWLKYQECKMAKRYLLVAVIVLLIFAAFHAYAQYTGFDIEKREPPSLLPQVGPGERAIINELRQANGLLEQNNQLLTEQNRVLRELLKDSKKK